MTTFAVAVSCYYYLTLIWTQTAVCSTAAAIGLPLYRNRIPCSSRAAMLGFTKIRVVRRSQRSPFFFRLFESPIDKMNQNEKEASTMKRYQIQGVGERSRVNLVTDTGHSISTDVPIKMGGENLAPQPVETLLAALIGCTQATAVFVGRQMRPERILIDRLEFNITASRDERGAIELPIDKTPSVPARLQSVSGEIMVYTKKPLSTQQLKVLQEQTELRCPVANLLTAAGCQMNVCWKPA